MLRSYRLLVAAAIAGLAIWAFMIGVNFSALDYPQQDRYQPYRYTSGQPADAETPPFKSPKTVEYRQPCQEPDGKDESDLCAQWKAARAGEASALWAERTFWIGIAGLAITALGTALLLRTVRQTDQALEVARTDSIENQKAAALAAAQYRIGFKPWLTVKVEGTWLPIDAPIHRFAPGETGRAILPNIIYTITNTSDMPATITKMLWELPFTPMLYNEDFWQVLSKGEQFQFRTDHGALGDRTKVIFAPFMLHAATREQGMTDCPPLRVAIHYLDPLGVKREWSFAYGGQTLFDHDLKRRGGPALNYEIEITD